MKKIFNYSIFAIIFTFSLAGLTQAASFTMGNVVVCRVGDGTAALSSAATPVFLDEYTPAGVLVQSIAMPTADALPNQTLTASGTATNECFITRSQNTRYIIITGYDAPVGTAAIAGTSTTAFTRVMGSINAAGVIDTSTTTTSFNTQGIRSAASDDGTRFWALGSGTGLVLQADGASGGGTLVSSTFTNMRVAQIFSGQLYVSAGAGAMRTGSVGSGLPTSTGTVITNLNGIPNGVPFTFNGFFFADLSAGVAGVDTLYVADDQTAAAGSVRKYTFDGTTWALTGQSPFAIYRGLAGSVTGGVVTLFSTRGTTGNELVTMSDATGYNGTFAPTPVSIATAAANTAMRGVVMAPISPTASLASISGRVTDTGGRPIANASIILTGGSLTHPITVSTGNFGYFSFSDLEVGQNYVITVSAKRHRFNDPSRVVGLKDDLTGMDFVANQ